MLRYFLLLIASAGLVSCASSSSSDSDAIAGGGAPVKSETTIGKDSNPFAFKQTDIQQGDDGSITGGKRSQYESKVESAYAKANSSVPAYLQRSYQKTAWSGKKNYSAGSYETSESKNTGKRSWFGGRKSNEANQVARASGQDYSTGSFKTGGANESGRSVRTGSNAYTESRTSDGWGRRPVILNEGEYHRNLSLGQAKSLLGR